MGNTRCRRADEPLRARVYCLKFIVQIKFTLLDIVLIVMRSYFVLSDNIACSEKNELAQQNENLLEQSTEFVGVVYVKDKILNKERQQYTF